jgi:hypothetical protein
MRLRRPVVCALLAGVGAILSACSTYDGTKLDPSGKIDEGQVVGIPYMLTRPEFVVKPDPAGGDKFAVSVSPVPDPEQRYTLRMSPAMFADIDFTMNLNDSGGVSLVDGKSTDKVGPTVKAFVDLALAGATLAARKQAAGNNPKALAALAKEEEEREAARKRIDSCATEETPARHAKCVVKKIGPDECGQGMTDALAGRIDRTYIDPTITKKDKKDFFSSFFYTTDPEQSCLAKVSAKWSKDVTLFLKKWVDAAQELKPTSAAEERFHARIRGILEQVDNRGARRLARAVEVASKSTLADAVRYRRLRRELELDASVAIDPTHFDCKAKCWSQQLVAVGLIQRAGGSNPPAIATAAAAAVVSKGFEAIAGAKPDTWRARRLAEFDGEIGALTLKVQQYEAAGNQQDAAIARATLAEQERKRAALLLLSNEYRQLARLEQRLKRPPPRSLAGRQSAMDEYKKERAEADALEQLISKSAEAMITAGKSKDAAPPPAPAAERTYPICIAVSKAPGWHEADGAGAPEFVVVLRPLVGSAERERDMPVEECP